MRRLATIAAVVLTLSVLPFASTAANAAPAGAQSVPAGCIYDGTYPEQWICIYVGNQLVFSGTAEAYGCGLTGPQFDLWYEPYPH